MKKLLVVDDQEITREVIKTCLEDSYEVIEACDGLEAMRVLQRNTDIALILLDLSMPNMNGEAFLFARSMMDEVSDIPVIIISSEDNEKIIETMKKAGANAYYVKPLDTEKLRETIKNIIGKEIKFGNTDKGYIVR